MPAKPSRKLPRRRRVSGSPGTNQWASTMVISGITAIRMPASPESIRCCPQAISRNGRQLPISAMITNDVHNRRLPIRQRRRSARNP